MFGFGKKPVADKVEVQDLNHKLKKTRKSFLSGLKDVLVGKKSLDAGLKDEIETRLLMVDVGIETSGQILQGLEQSIKGNISETEVLDKLSTEMLQILQPVEQPFVVDETKTPYVIFMVGVNGVGKTTTIGKLARKLKDEGKSVMLAAGDTFRAAAVEQLKIWGERNDVPVVAQETGSDSASVIFDAIASAKAKNIDVLIADTAGRLHTQSNLMEELKKIKRVMQKHNSEYPHETILVLDASVGQNTLSQAEEFNGAIGVDGIILSKMDGTAKGGILLSLAYKLKIPVRFIGVGESVADLRIFKARELVNALVLENDKI